MGFPEPSRKLSQEHYQLIGRVAAEWSFLESRVDMGLWGAASLTQETGRALMSYLNFHNRLEMLLKLAERKKVSKTALSELKDIASEIRIAYSKRNEVVHALWYADDHGDYQYVAFQINPKRGKFNEAYAVFELSEIEPISAMIQETSNKLVVWLNENISYPPED